MTTTLISGYVARLSALSTNQTPTELAGSGYARVPVTVN
jgi:hypothetical protein